MKQTEEQRILYNILGPTAGNIGDFLCAVCEMEDLLFSKKVSLDSIRVTKDIYSPVAEQRGKSKGSVARQIQRIGNRCWENMDEAQKKLYIGKIPDDIHSPRDMLFYFAVYAVCQKSFHQVLEEDPELLLGRSVDL